MELDQRRKEGGWCGWEASSLGFVEIFIGQGWLVKLNIYADLTCLFNLRLGKYVS